MGDYRSEDTMIREYLLGRLDNAPEVAERLAERMLTETELSELVDVIEDEIIEEYLEGQLEPADRQAIEKHFLRPPERREKLRLARILHRGLKLKADDAAANQEKEPPLPAG